MPSTVPSPVERPRTASLDELVKGPPRAPTPEELDAAAERLSHPAPAPDESAPIAAHPPVPEMPTRALVDDELLPVFPRLPRFSWLSRLSWPTALPRPEELGRLVRDALSRLPKADRPVLVAFVGAVSFFSFLAGVGVRGCFVEAPPATVQARVETPSASGAPARVHAAPADNPAPSPHAAPAAHPRPAPQAGGAAANAPAAPQARGVGPNPSPPPRATPPAPSRPTPRQVAPSVSAPRRAAPAPRAVTKARAPARPAPRAARATASSRPPAKAPARPSARRTNPRQGPAQPGGFIRRAPF
jgi:hypothetical protein